MRVKTVQINWHDKLPIFSVDFDGNYTDAAGDGNGWRFATGGGDNNVRVWRLRSQKERDMDPHTPPVEFLASLNRHTAPVNVVRFSPCSSKLASAGDDGVIIIWRHVLDDHRAARTQATLNPSGTGGVDSDDGGFVEPEVWRPIALLRGSLADICDLAWSPDGRFIVSASVDNTARIWDATESRCVQVLADHTHYVQGVTWDPLGEFIITQSSDRSMRVYRNDNSDEVAAAASTNKHHTGHRNQRLFHDDNLASFFRRPSISPDGRLFATAAGIQRDRAARNTCYIWARDRLQGSPVLSLAGHQKPVVATRWAPRKDSGWLKQESGEDMGHRMMLAVASQSSVVIYDTSQGHRALGLMGGLHYAAITDLAWTRDGSHLIITSIDGFASIASIAQPSQPLADRDVGLPSTSAQCSSGAISEERQPVHDSGAAESPHGPAEAAATTTAATTAAAAAASSSSAGTESKSKGKKRLAPTFVSSL
ncbi:WD40 repeat-like protein [Martensiomyces pterosporus]|nr:WD40 repeat-like protein [Martensiomyces pterosporus]